MTKSIHRELLFPQPRDLVWKGLTNSAALAEWLFPNDFEPRVGHQFTFQVPGNPKVNFDGMTVECEVLVCDPPNHLVFSWSAAVLLGTQVSFKLEPDGNGTRLLFEHSGFDVTQPQGNLAFKGAEWGWTNMFGKLPAVLDCLQKNESKEPKP